VASSSDAPQVYVLAGANGAGKTSVAGAAFSKEGAEYFNPDEATQRILSANPGFSLAEANSAAWNEGRRLLERAIDEKLNFAFETTLGGKTITSLRYTASRINLIRLLPKLTELILYGNSAEADPETGVTPTPLLILHLDGGKILDGCNATLVPEWAKPIVAAALKLEGS